MTHHNAKYDPQAVRDLLAQARAHPGVWVPVNMVKIRPDTVTQGTPTETAVRAIRQLIRHRAGPFTNTHIDVKQSHWQLFIRIGDTTQ